MSVSERLRAVVARTFRMPIELVDDATTPAAVAAWDSLGQMELVTALEQEFSTEFTPTPIHDLVRKLHKDSWPIYGYAELLWRPL